MPENLTPPNPASAHTDVRPEKLRDDLYRRFSAGGIRRQQWRHRWLRWSLLLTLHLAAEAKHLLDWLIAAGLILICTPLLMMGLVLSGGRWQHTPRVGRWCEPFDELSFAVGDHALGRWLKRFRLHRLPVLFNILKGEMSFVGPRAVAAGTLKPRERAARLRYDVRPGLICLWWVRQRSNIAFESEAEVDGEYVSSRSLRGDLGIVLRAIPAVLYGQGARAACDIVKILGIRMHNLTMSETLDALLAAMKGDTPRQVSFVNADCANLAYRDVEYQNVLNRADFTLADGIGLKLAGNLLARPIKQNVNGTDLFPRLCAALAETDHGIYLLGARPGIAETVADWIAVNHPTVKVCGHHHGYFSPAEEPAVVREIAQSGAALLLVAFGAPRQDKWIAAHLSALNVKVVMGVGGLFDFYSGRIPRAPLWLREAGFEWLYRFWQEPRRMWRRYFLGNALFLGRVLKERSTNVSGEGMQVASAAWVGKE